MSNQKRFYLDSYGLWVVGDYESIPANTALLSSPADGYISISVPGMSAPLENVLITEIESDATGTAFYTDLDSIKTAGKDFFNL